MAPTRESQLRRGWRRSRTRALRRCPEIRRLPRGAHAVPDRAPDVHAGAHGHCRFSDGQGVCPVQADPAREAGVDVGDVRGTAGHQLRCRRDGRQVGRARCRVPRVCTRGDRQHDAQRADVAQRRARRVPTARTSSGRTAAREYTGEPSRTICGASRTRRRSRWKS